MTTQQDIAGDQTRDVVLRLQGLTVRLRDKQAPKTIVQDVSFEIHAGETLCVVGESGSGKSVTSFSIMGLLPREDLEASAGTILLDGEDLLQATPLRLKSLRATRMSMVFQEPMTALNPLRTVGWQIDEVLRVHTDLSPQARKQRTIEMLTAVQLPEVERIYHSYPHQLSGGQRQRIVICMALILKPRLLIADEPTTALDVTTQRQILLLIKELQKTHNTAVLFVTHDFGVVAEIADRIAVMKQGKLVELASRQEILTAPKDPYTKLLIAAVPSLVPPSLPEPTGSPILVVDALCKKFIERRLFKPVRTVNAVQDARFVLRPKEVLGIVGESGSGKSTLARCIARLIEPSSGSVKIDGIEVAQATRREFKPLRRRIQIVFQDPYRSLNGRLRVGDSLVEGMRNFGFTRGEARVRAIELLQTVGLEADVMQRYPHQFSGGQRQRICIARALAPSPDILIADEAVSALDVSVQAQVLALLNDIRLQTNIAVIFITHDLRVAAQICNNLIVMRAGQMVEVGQAQTILTKPRHAYTQELLDAAPGRHWDFQNFCAMSSG